MNQFIVQTKPSSTVNHRKEFLWISAIALTVLVCDWITKIWAVYRLQNKPPIDIIPGVFRFAYGENTGIAFGLFQNHGGWLHIVAPVAFIALIVIIYKQFAEIDMDIWYRLIFGLLIGGAMGNISNRFTHGYVIDFIDVFIGTYNWPTFNIADSALTVGEIILVIKLFFWHPHPINTSDHQVTTKESHDSKNED